VDVLLIVQDPLVRDMIAIGFENVPETEVVAAAGPTAVDRARNKKFDVVFMGHDPREKENSEGNAEDVIARLREIDKEAEAVVVTDARSAKTLGEKRDKLGPCSFLRTPIQPNEFFRLAVRLRSRRSQAAGARPPKGGR
jgi:DNA-binding NarL/FixJ family response regulator